MTDKIAYGNDFSVTVALAGIWKGKGSVSITDSLYHILQGIRIVSFVSYSNSLINNDGFHLNISKRSSKAISSELVTRQLVVQYCSEGSQNPLFTHISHCRSHFTGFIRIATAVNNSTNRKVSHGWKGACPPPCPGGSSVSQDGFYFPCTVLWPQKSLASVLAWGCQPSCLCTTLRLLKGSKLGEVENSFKEAGPLVQGQTALSMTGKEEAGKKDMPWFPFIFCWVQMQHCKWLDRSCSLF